jgi:hypothetical protein
MFFGVHVNSTIDNDVTSNQNVVSRLQDILREAGCLFRLQNLLTYPKVNVQHTAIKALGNLALNQENQKELKVCNFMVFLQEPSQSAKTLHVFELCFVGGWWGGGGAEARHFTCYNSR